jgi:hypothetical protein
MNRTLFPNRLRAALLCLAGGLALASPASGAPLAICRPKIGAPAFPLTNGTLTLEIEAARGLAANGWSVRLANDLRAWTCSVERVESGRYLNCNSATGYLLTARLPPGIAPELFNLAVSHAAGGSAANRHCVNVLTNYETDFYILHLADPQVETDNATAANGAGNLHGSVQAIRWAAPAYSLIHPRFILDTGDEVDNGQAELYPKYLEAIRAIGAPLLITRGNNDAQGKFADWQRDLGPSTYSITMGSFYVGLNDYTTSTNRAWFTNDYAASFAKPGITFRLLGQHWNSGRQAYAPAAGQSPDLMLVGHNHSFATLSTNPYYVLSSGPGWDYGAVGILEFHKQGQGWVCLNKTTHGKANKLQVYGDWGRPGRVASTFSQDNNGTAFTNAAFVTNGLNYDFWDGRIRFLMRKIPAGYAVGGGEKITEYDYSATNTAVLVKVNIRKNALTIVTVFPFGPEKISQPGVIPPPAGPTATNRPD